MSRFGKTSQYFADEEIILSAGAVGSPQILMLSGVGDRDHLDELGIRIIHHSPQVGQNLQDHLIVPLAFDTPEPLGLDILAGSKEVSVQWVLLSQFNSVSCFICY